MAFVCTGMPVEMRDTLYDRLKASLDNIPIFQHRLLSQGEDRPFETLHFSWWNRYGVSVSPSPIFDLELMIMMAYARVNQPLMTYILSSLLRLKAGDLST
jgi:hypothetical protein